MKTFKTKLACLSTIKDNMNKNGCPEEEIREAQKRYLELIKTQPVEIAPL